MEIQKFEYLENEKSFLDEIKTSFIVFEWLSFCGKKNCQKIADTNMSIARFSMMSNIQFWIILL